MKKATLAATTIAIVMMASLAIAQPGPRGPQGANPPGPMAPGAGLVEFLGLDDAQLEAWTAYHDEFRATVDPIHEAMQELHGQLREALESDTPDATAIGQLMLDIKDLQDQIAAAHETLDQNLKSILTTDQILKFEAFRAAQAQLGRGPGGPGQGHGPGSGNPGFGAGPGNGTGPCS